MDQRGVRDALRNPRLVFDGDKTKNELWETKMMGHLMMDGAEIHSSEGTIDRGKKSGG